MTDIFDGLGFIPVDELQSIFTHETSKIELDLRRNGIPPNPKDILDYIDNIRLLLLKRSKQNLDGYMKNHPLIRKDIRESKVATDLTDNKKTWEERIKNNRAKGYLTP